jgi:hypothetical protein
MEYFLALTMIVALITSIRLYATDDRHPADQFAKTYTIDKRRFAVVENLRPRYGMAAFPISAGSESRRWRWCLDE